MIRANIHEIKAHFSSYVRRAKAGETVIVCERNIPVAELRPLATEEKPKPRQLGTMKGLVLWMADDALEPMSDEEADEIYNAPLFDGEEQ